MLQVEVPAGVGPGEQFMAQIPGGGTAVVTVPEGCTAGTMISIQTEAAPSAMAMARTPEQELLQKAIMQVGTWKGHFRSPEAAICCMLIKAVSDGRQRIDHVEAGGLRLLLHSVSMWGLR